MTCSRSHEQPNYGRLVVLVLIAKSRRSVVASLDRCKPSYSVACALLKILIRTIDRDKAGLEPIFSYAQYVIALPWPSRPTRSAVLLKPGHRTLAFAPMLFLPGSRDLPTSDKNLACDIQLTLFPLLSKEGLTVSNRLSRWMCLRLGRQEFLSSSLLFIEDDG